MITDQLQVFYISPIRGDHQPRSELLPLRSIENLQFEGKLDQELLAEKEEEWTGEDTGNLVFFRPRTEDGDKESSSFLLIFQSERQIWQRTSLFGRNVSGYYIVATMLVENENAVSLAEALDRLKEANRGFSPSEFMIDASETWVWAFRGNWLTLVINTNSGVESQNKVFKYEYLVAHKESTVTSLVRKLVQHMKEVETKTLSITDDYITRLDEISFIVRSGANPICLAVFHHFDDVSFSWLCDIYTANPIFNLDGDLFNKSDNTLPCFLNEDNSMEGLGESKECIEGVRETLSSVVEQMTKACPKSGGLLLEKTESKRTGMAQLPKRKRRKQGVSNAQAPCVDDESPKKNPSEYAMTEPGKCERDRTGKKVKWDDNFENANEFYFDIESQKGDHGIAITFQVIDGYWAHLTQSAIDKGQIKIKHELCSTMTSIMDDAHMPKNNKYRVYEYDMIVGAYIQRGNLWDLLVDAFGMCEFYFHKKPHCVGK
ncbi:hypothetical protein DPMN_172949 [Dreissena polymorpha]|uniref:Uncharacterized protein n=1 Tax=Dreissena polymorpha TaxID=45954 RepID=A0A9D4E1Y4_DREPO|nr:hypothetical protein DPMN_172949 [Dreissena polymorpha]